MKSGIFQWLLAFIIVMVIFIAGVYTFDKILMPVYTRHGEEIEVPEVVEMNFVEADSLLRISGFHLVVEREQYDWNYPAGTIISQNPEAFAITKRGRRIYVTTSIGEKLSTMPNLVGKSARDASFTAQSAGLELPDECFGYEYSNYYPENVVMGQSIPPGTNLRKNTPIHVTVSLGNLPNEFKVPDVTGQSLELAKRVILTSGLEIGDIEYLPEPDLLPNTIISQEPEPDTKVDRNDPVHLVVSTLDEPEESADSIETDNTGTNIEEAY